MTPFFLRHALLLTRLTLSTAILGSFALTLGLPREANASPSGLEYDVRDCGAKLDGRTDDTSAIQACIDRVPASGGTVRIPRGTGLARTSRTIFNGSRAGKSNLHILCDAGAGIDFEPVSPIDTAHHNDRAVAFDWAEPLMPRPRFLSSAAIAAGASTLSCRSPADCEGLSANQWLLIEEKDPKVHDIVTFEAAQVKQIAGSQILLREPLKSEFANDHSPSTLMFQALSANPVGNDSIAGCIIESRQQNTGTPGISVARAWNTKVVRNLITIANGQPLYTTRSIATEFGDNRVVATNANPVGSEFASSVGLNVHDNTFSCAPSSSATAGVLIDLGTSFFHFDRNKLECSVDIAIQVTNHAHDGSIRDNTIAPVSGSGTAILGRGATNVQVSGNSLLGGKGMGISFGRSVNLERNFATGGNTVSGNHVSRFRRNYDVEGPGDSLECSPGPCR